MRNWLAKLRPNPWLLRKLLMLAILVGVGVAAFCWGRRQHADATPPRIGPDGQPTESGDYSRRVVAYLYENRVPVTREELGEYLIARFGAERLDFMINRKIVDMECRKYNIFASDREVEDRFQQDLKSFNTPLTKEEFVNSILRRFGKTLYEWKEDVIRPKIMMEKLVKSQVKITEKDVREGFEARYGPKVECRMIVCEKDKMHVATKVWENARKGPEAFREEAKKQFIPNLASTEGKVPPIHKFFGDKELEETAFRLKEGEVSALLQMKDGTYVILLCEKHLPANPAVRLASVWQELSKEMFELRVAQRIPEVFAEMRKQAMPRVVLDNTGSPSSSVAAPPVPLPGLVPQVSTPPAKPIDVPPPPTPSPVVPPAGFGPTPELPDHLPAPMGITPPPMDTTAAPMGKESTTSKK
jgi:hypothetical protein